MKKILTICMVIGSAAVSQAVLVDDFQTYSTGLVSGGATTGVWTALLGVTAPANLDTATIQDEGGNLLLTMGATTAGSGAYRALPSAIPGSTAATTVFMRLRANDTGVNTSIGLSDVATPTDANNFGVFEPQLRMINTGGSNLRFNVRNGAAFTDLTTPTAITLSQWYNVWMVVSTVTDTWNIYINTGSADATVGDLKMSSIAFRDGTDANTALTTLLFYTGATAVGGSMAASIDNIYMSDGLNLVNPVPEPATMSMLALGLGALFLRKRK